MCVTLVLLSPVAQTLLKCNNSAMTVFQIVLDEKQGHNRFETEKLGVAILSGQKQHMLTRGCGVMYLLPMLIKHRSFATQCRPTSSVVSGY